MKGIGAICLIKQLMNTAFAKLVMDQDAKACELNQKGLHAAPLEQGVLMPEEYILQRFHQWVRDGLGRA